MAYTRRQSDNVYHYKYRKVKTYWNECIYCGAPAVVWDHVPPISLAYHYAGNQEIKFLLVPACGECNALLSNHDIPTVDERKNYLLNRITKKYRKILKMPDWSDSELEEIKGYINKFVKSSQHKQNEN
jgi:hypothetical protein